VSSSAARTRSLPDVDDPRFPVVSRRAFFNHAGVSPIPAVAAEAMADHATRASRAAAVPGWYEESGRVRELAARLVNGRADEIAVIPNTSTGLALFGRGLRWKRDDVVVTSGVEFPANRYLWDDIADRYGVRLVVVEPVDDTGRVDPDDLILAVRTHFRPGGVNVLALSLVQYATGQRFDPAPLAEACRAAGGMLALDAIQAVGACEVDVERDGIDFLAADGHKWMLGPEGVGIAWFRPEIMDRLDPLVPGWLGMKDPFAIFGGAPYRFEYREDARRFEPGCWNLIGMIGLAASLDLLLDVGVPAIEASIEARTARIRAGLDRLGARIVSPGDDRPASERSGIVLARFPDRPADFARTLAARLGRAAIDVVPRAGNALRVSPHYYTPEAHVDHLIAAVEDALRD